MGKWVIRREWWGKGDYSVMKSTIGSPLTFSDLREGRWPQTESIISAEIHQILWQTVHETFDLSPKTEFCFLLFFLISRPVYRRKGIQSTETQPLKTELNEKDRLRWQRIMNYRRGRWERWVERLTAAICASSIPPSDSHDMKIIAEDVLSTSLVN